MITWPKPTRCWASCPPGMILSGLAILLSEKGDYPEALEIHRKLQGLAPSFRRLSMIGRLEALRGNAGEARHILKQFEEAESRGKSVSPICFAVVYLGLGDAD